MLIALTVLIVLLFVVLCIDMAQIRRYERCVLHVLRVRGPLTGRELVEAKVVRRGVIYVVLSRLQDDGLIKRNRRGYYTLTEKGETFQ